MNTLDSNYYNIQDSGMQLDESSITDKSAFLINGSLKFFFFYSIYRRLGYNSHNKFSLMSPLSFQTYKCLPLSFIDNAVSVLLLNLSKSDMYSYINIINNFFDIYGLLQKLIKTTLFFVSIKEQVFSKRKEKRKKKIKLRFKLLKREKRALVSMFFLKKFVLLSDSDNLNDKLYDCISDIFLNKSAS